MCCIRRAGPRWLAMQPAPPVQRSAMGRRVACELEQRWHRSACDSRVFMRHPCAMRGHQRRTACACLRDDVAKSVSHCATTASSPQRFFARTMPAVIGKPAPAFTANAVQPDGSFKPVKLSDYKGALPRCRRRRRPRAPRRADAPTPRRRAGKYVVLFFYPLDFTFVCPVRAHARPATALQPTRACATRPLTRPTPPLPRRPDGDHRLQRPRQGVRRH